MTKAEATRAVRNAIRREGLVIPKTFSEVHCGGRVVTAVDAVYPVLAEVLQAVPGVERVTSNQSTTVVRWTSADSRGLRLVADGEVQA